MRGREREGEKVQNKKLRASEMGRRRKRNFGERRRGEREMKKKVKNIFFENNNHFNFNFILFQTFYRAEQTEKKIVNFLKKYVSKDFFFRKICVDLSIFCRCLKNFIT